MSLRYVVLDFDGTCTRVDQIQATYMERYRALLSEAVGSAWVDGLWDAAERELHELSPHAGWTLGGAQAAPVTADPYILSGEIVLHMQRHDGGGAKVTVPEDLYPRAYEEATAPWRDETATVLEALVATGVKVCFVSNASTGKLTKRLAKLLENKPGLFEQIPVYGDAGKFRVREPFYEARTFEASGAALWGAFAGLPLGAMVPGLQRPVYLRRGAYFEALCRLWKGDPQGPARTLVVGDVWELVLAMPAAMGSHVHLIERAAPYGTFAYEREGVLGLGARGAVSATLEPVVERVRGLRG